MALKGSNKYGKLSEKRLQAFEAELGASLPDDYRAHLLAHNGAQPEPAWFHISKSQGDTRVANLYGLHRGPDQRRLDAMYGIYRGQVPLDALPIGDDPFGNVICIGLAGRRRGRIYFWDHETELDPRAPYKRMPHLADRFPAFLDMLGEAPANAEGE